MPRPPAAATRRGVLAASLSLLALPAHAQASRELLNVSYDPTREFYRDYNAAFARAWQAAHRPGACGSTPRMAGPAARRAR